MIRDLFKYLVQIVFHQILRFQKYLYPLNKNADLCQVSSIYYRLKAPLSSVIEQHFICGGPTEEALTKVLEPYHVAIENQPDHTVLLRSEEDIYNVEKYPFFYNAIYKESRQKIIVPTVPFVELIESQPWPDVHLIFLWSTGRCGSTLLANLFTSFDNFCTISEPDDIFNTFVNNRIPENSVMYEKCLVNSLKYHLIQVKKRYPKTKYVTIKPRSMCFWYISKTPHQIKDKVTHIFMYRDVTPTIKSFQKAFGNYNPPMNSLVSRVFGIEEMVEQMIGPLEMALESIPELKETVTEAKTLRKTSVNLMVRMVFGGLPYLLLLYHRLIETGYYQDRLFAVKYERLIADPVGQFEKIAKRMKSCGFTISQKERDRLEVLSKKDSQENSSISRKKLNVNSGASGNLKPEAEELLTAVMTACKLTADMEENFLLPETV